MKLNKNRIIDFIYYVEQNIGSRIAGSKEEKLIARYIKSILSHNSDKTDIESFFCNSRSSQHEFNTISIIYLLGIIAYINYPPSTLFFIFLYIIYIIFDKFYAIKIIDFIYSKSKSHNLISVIKPFKEIKNTIIFTSHLDSPYINKLYESKYKDYLSAFNLIFPILFFLLFIVTLIKINHWADILIDYLYLMPFLAIGLVIYLQNKFVTYEKSFGANNGLSGVAINLELANHFFIERTNNTQIIIANFGAKEANLSGSKYFLNKNLDILKEAYIINIDSVAGGILHILESEKNIKHNNEVIKIIIDIAKEQNINLECAKSEVVTTDASTFSYEKFKSVSFLSFDKYGIPLRYCLKEDLPQYMFEEDLQNVFKICVKFVEYIDEREKRT
ncbi:MAG: M28 family peptidase [Candidatus Sericytochromatia bacterium]